MRKGDLMEMSMLILAVQVAKGLQVLRSNGVKIRDWNLTPKVSEVELENAVNGSCKWYSVPEV